MLIERLRRALLPEYEVLEEIAGGGMGIVYSARQVSLERIVAVKLLRPELANAVAAERFLEEPRIQAGLSSHPGIVPVYDAKEVDGLFCYFMEFVEGETLAERLLRGSLPPSEAQTLASDLLDALGFAHAQGVIHRDIKPANVFLRNGRALLCDFGIARRRDRPEQALTATGQLPFTLAYVAPEQLEGNATERTDVYASALVLWEASAGARWAMGQAPDQAEWNRVPASMVDALRRALAPLPADRFANAGEMRAALTTKPAPRTRRRVLLGILAAAVAIAVGWRLLSPAPAGAPGLTLRVESFLNQGVPGGDPLRDSVSRALIAALSGYPDLRVLPSGTDSVGPGTVRLSGVLIPADGGVRLELRASGGEAGGVVTTERTAPAGAAWPELVRQVADSFLAAVWRGSLAGDRWLPINALPRTGDGLSRWHAAERLYAGARWEEAHDAYARIESTDSTCLLCTYRLIDITRWIGGEPDSQRFQLLNRHLDAFPPHYRDLILAQQQPWPARYEKLRAAADRYQEFFLASFLLGDELFHRGPLYGHLREEAIEPLQHALQLRPDFGPGWEHLGWVLLSEGSAAGAKAAIDSVPPVPGGADLSNALRLMLKVGYLWRFGAPEEAAAVTRGVLHMQDVIGNYRTASGGRIMMTVDAPAGAVGLGSQLAAWQDKPEAVRAGLLAEAHGFAALGRRDSLQAVGIRLRRDPDHALGLYALELQSLLVLADPEDSLPADPALLSALQAYTPSGAEAEPLRQRAAWMLAMLSVRAGDAGAAARYRGLLGSDGPRNTLRTQVEIMDLLRRGENDPAGRRLAGLTRSDLSRVVANPVEDAVHRLLRVTWLEQTGAPGQAEQELRWHEHLQLDGFPTGMPQPGEVAWAMSTLLRWRRARLLDHGNASDLELCSCYRAVARLWGGAVPRLAARAAIAGRRATELKCGAAA